MTKAARAGLVFIVATLTLCLVGGFAMTLRTVVLGLVLSAVACGLAAGLGTLTWFLTAPKVRPGG